MKALVLLAALAAPAAAPAQPAVVQVKATGGMRFVPAEVTIPAGGTVEWKNTAIFPHTVTDDPALAKVAGDAALPEGAEAFDSGKLGFHKTWRRTFTTPGRYVYFCRPHETHGMVGVVIVQPAG
jgi:plastocyanin